MKAALDKNVKASLHQASQTNKEKPKSLADKGVPTDITDAEFKEFLDLNKILYAKAERLKSKMDGRVLPIFRLEINDPTEAEALISQNLVCQVTGIVFEVEEFRSPFRSSSATTAKVSVTRQKHGGQNKNVSSMERTFSQRMPKQRSKEA